MSLEFRLITLQELRALEAGMLQAHFEEGSTYREEAPLNVDWAGYEQHERRGTCLTVGAFDGPRLVGYSGVARVPDLFYSSIVSGVLQLIYLKPAYRKGMNGFRLLRYMMRLAKALGCNQFTVSVSRGRKREAQWIASLGFKHRELVFTKSL